MEDESSGGTRTVVAVPGDGSRDETLVETIVRVVSEAESRAPMELPQVYSAIDPDALLAICGERAEKTRDGRCSVTFEYSDSSVVVDRGAITVTTR